MKLFNCCFPKSQKSQFANRGIGDKIRENIKSVTKSGKMLNPVKMFNAMLAQINKGIDSALPKDKKSLAEIVKNLPLEKASVGDSYIHGPDRPSASKAYHYCPGPGKK